MKIIVIYIIFVMLILSGFAEAATRRHKNVDVKVFKQHKYIALTFDDGPHPVYTPKILDLLEYYNVKATFFVVGQRVHGNEAILRRMIQDGDEIGNHTWSHPKLTRLSNKKIQKEVRDDQQIIMKSAGYEAKLFRPPYGSYNALTKKVIGMPFILWTIDTLDWKNQKTDIIVQRIIRKAGRGSIILLHDIHASALEVMKIIIPQLKKSGFIFVTVSELEKL